MDVECGCDGRADDRADAAMSLSGAEKARRLQRALEFGGNTHRLDDVVQLLKDGKAKLFENEGGVIVSEINIFPQFRAVNFWLLAGELHDVLALEDDVLAWGLDQGCTIATAAGRKGWGRVSAKTGWRPHMPTFYKRLMP